MWAAALIVWAIYFALEARDDREQRGDGYMALMLATIGWCIGLSVMLGGVAGGLRDPALLPIGIAGFVYCFPWTTVRVVFVPLGMYRTAALVARLAYFAWRSMPSARLVAGTWALCQQSTPSTKALRRLQQRMARHGARRPALPYDPGHVLACGLLISIEDAQAARPLIASVLDFERCSRFHTAHGMACEWLAAEAATRGDWAAIVALAERRLPKTRAFRLLAAVARRATGTSNAPGSRGLWLRWLVAPHRRRTRGFVRMAVARGETTARERVTIARHYATGDRPPLATAIHNHVVLCTLPASAVVASDINAVGRAWDAALNASDTRDMLRHRAALLRVRDPDAVLAQVRKEVASEIAAHLGQAAGHIDLDEIESELGYDALSDQSGVFVDQMETALERLLSRIQSGEQGAMELWREWAIIRATYEAHVADCTEGRRFAVFTALHDLLAEISVRLWDDVATEILSGAVTLWLLAEATACGDEDAMDLHGHNAAL